jgi:hypothetical protein
VDVHVSIVGSFEVHESSSHVHNLIITPFGLLLLS